MGVIYTIAKTDTDLQQILNLQQANLPRQLNDSVKKAEGFVTVEHTFEILKAMNDTCPHIIAKDEDCVIGYVLSMTKTFGSDIPVLQPLFNKINALLPQENYVVMGQVCVAQTHRKQGVFRLLYEHMKTHVKPQFTSIITEIDAKNTRSLNAHNAIGFKTIHRYITGSTHWNIVKLDL